MREQNQKKENYIIWIFSAIIAVIICLIIACKFGFYYSSNDDIMIHNLMSGVYTGKPEAHLVYVMYVLGLVFKGLYTILPNIDWYGIFAVCGHFLCLILITARIAFSFENKKNRLWALIISWLVICSVDLKFIVGYQYTAFAGVLVATAITYIVTAKNEKRLSDFLVVVLFLLLAFLLRKQIFFLSLPLIILSLGFLIFKDGFNKKNLIAGVKNILIPTGVFAVLICASFIVEKSAYSSPEWEYFKEFNQARTSVYDYSLLPEYSSNEDFYNALGIYEAEYTALKQNDLELLDYVDADLLNALATRQEEINKEWQQYYNVPLHFIKVGTLGFLSLLKTPYGILTLVLTLYWFITSIIIKKKFKALFSLLPIMFDYAVTAYFVNLNRFPERVAYPLFLMSIATLTGAFILDFNRQKIVDGLLIALTVGMLGYQVYETNAYTRTLEANTSDWVQLNRYFKENAENVYIADSAVCGLASEKIFSDPIEADNFLRMSTWLTKSPNQDKREEMVNVSKEFYLVLPSRYTTDWIQSLGFTLEGEPQAIFDNVKLVKVIDLQSP